MVKIISDSTCDLSPELLTRYDIDILPLHILLGDEEFEDGKNITPEQIFQWADANKTTPKTSAPSLAETIELFRPYVEEKREIVCFSISSSMSTSGNVMRLAAEELEATELVTVIDSANLSTGIGLLVIEAAILAGEGKKASEIAAVMEDLKPRVRASFVVDTLTYLYRGGRCNAVAAMAGSVLKLHPKIVVENGAMDASRIPINRANIAEALHCLHKNFICVNLRVWCIFNNSALVTRTCGKLTKCIGFHFITFIKCTGNTVCIDVPAKQHRYKISFFEIHC